MLLHHQRRGLGRHRVLAQHPADRVDEGGLAVPPEPVQEPHALLRHQVAQAVAHAPLQEALGGDIGHDPLEEGVPGGRGRRRVVPGVRDLRQHVGRPMRPGLARLKVHRAGLGVEPERVGVEVLHRAPDARHGLRQLQAGIDPVAALQAESGPVVPVRAVPERLDQLLLTLDLFWAHDSAPLVCCIDCMKCSYRSSAAACCWSLHAKKWFTTRCT